jgi:hypothetical protein
MFTTGSGLRGRRDATQLIGQRQQIPFSASFAQEQLCIVLFAGP